MPQISEAVFLSRLQDLLVAEVAGLDTEHKASVLRRAADVMERDGRPLQCRMVPFMPGRRPSDEAAHPGLGSSEAVAGIPPDGKDDPPLVLSPLPGPSGKTSVRVRVPFPGPDGTLPPVVVPGWRDREAVPLMFATEARGDPRLTSAKTARGLDDRRVIAISPGRDLLPGGAW